MRRRSVFTTHGLLEALLQLFERRPTTHTTGALARDANSNPVAATSPYATCWCTNGGLLYLTGAATLDDRAVAPALDLLTRAAQQLGFACTSKCNDALGRDGAKRMCRIALTTLEGSAP